MEQLGYQPGVNINDILNNQTEVNNIEDISKIEKLLEELRLKEDKEKVDPGNRSDFLD